MRIPQISDFPGPRQEENAHPETIGRAIRAVDQASRPRSLYLHCPFCFHKCHYCDFYSIVADPGKQAAFGDRLAEEIRVIGPLAGGTIQTVFIGGGTPTLLPARLWKEILATLHDSFAIDTGTEFTVEANPETLNPEIAAILAKGGVNRISIGAQTFFPKHLSTLERWHDPESVGEAVRVARNAGIERISLDLIFGIPGQTPGEWQSDLDEALALDPEHLSCYALTFEPGTPLTVRRDQGTVHPIDEDLEAEMFHLTRDRLSRAGLVPYEISNFARPGALCRHNLVYWRNGNWLAIGPSASGHFNGYRWKNKAHLGEYLDSTGFAPLSELELPDAATALADHFLMGLRLMEGVPLAESLDRGKAIDRRQSLEAAIASLESRALLATDGDRIRLTDDGVLLADGVIGEIIQSVRP